MPDFNWISLWTTAVDQSESFHKLFPYTAPIGRDKWGQKNLARKTLETFLLQYSAGEFLDSFASVPMTLNNVELCKQKVKWRKDSPRNEKVNFNLLIRRFVVKLSCDATSKLIDNH